MAYSRGYTRQSSDVDKEGTVVYYAGLDSTIHLNDTCLPVLHVLSFGEELSASPGFRGLCGCVCAPL